MNGRMSGLWGYQSALDLFLEENGITTLLFAGVNTDQVPVSLHYVASRSSEMTWHFVIVCAWNAR